MIFLDNLIPLIAAWMPFWDFILPIMFLSFIAVVPCFIRGLYRNV